MAVEAKTLGRVVVTGHDIIFDGGYPSGGTFGGGGSYSMVIPPGGGGSGHTTSSTTSTAKPAQDKNPCPAKKTDPIMLDTGAKVEEVTDFALPGEMGLSFVRYYNSRYTCSSTACQVSLGSWSTNLDYKLNVVCTMPATPDMLPNQLPGGGMPQACGSASFDRPDGSTLTFSSTQPFYGTPGETVPLPGPFNGIGTATLSNNGDGTYTVHDEDAHNLIFDAQGNLLAIKDASGIGWTLTRPDANTVVVTHTNGQSFSLKRINASSTYGAPKEIDVTDPAGHVYVYQSTTGFVDAYAQNTSLIGVIDSVTLPGSPSTVIGYQYYPDKTSLDYAQLKEVDYNGVAHDLTGYDSAGRANMSSLANGNANTSIVYSSNSTGSTATLTNPLGHVDVYQFNSSDLLVSISGQAVAGAAGCDASFASTTYDAGGDMLSSTDNNGNVAQYTYDDATGLLQKKIEATGSPVQRTTDYSWDPTPGTDRPLSVTVEGYAQTAYAYDAQNRVHSVTVTNLSSNGSANQALTTTYTYALYSNGLVHTLSVAHPSPQSSATDVYGYDSLGRLTSATNGLGQATAYGNYNGLNEPGEIVGPNGDETDYTYDARGRVATKVTHPNGTAATWIYGYDGFGLPASETDPDGMVTQWNREADMLVHTITRTNKDGLSTETFGYDANNDVTSDVIARGSDIGLSESMSYDVLGRLHQKLGQHGQELTYSYDLDDNVLSVTNAVGHIVAYQYDALNRVNQVTESGGASLTPPVISLPASNTTGSYAVSWSAVGSASSYVLQEQLNGGGWSTVYTGSDTSFSVSGKGDGTYGYQVQACNAGGCSGVSAAASLSVLLPPPTPASLSVPGASSGAVAISWSSASTATSYTLQHALNGASWSTIYNGGSTSYTQQETVTGSWTYQVQACNSSGCSPFRVSGAVAVTIPPASAPSLSVPASNTTGSYTVSWGSVSGATSETLQEQVNGGSWITVYSGSATSQAFSGKLSGSSYGYRVQACNGAGCGPWSATASTTVLLVPAAPTSVSIPASSNGPVAVSWAASATATSYTLQHADYGVTGWSTIYSGSATGDTEYETTTGSWSYQVQACNASGCSAFVVSSSSVAVTIAPTSGPSLSVPATSTTGSYTVSWGAVSGATSYTLRRTNTGTNAVGTAYSGPASSVSDYTVAGTYLYAVNACNAVGCSGWRNAAVDTTVFCSIPPAVAKRGGVQPYILKCNGTPAVVGNGDKP